ncbi:phospholipase D [Artemisia annua]|uniref:Phospholipase D n=1 Tax=Artemisia annua TaxID=35608 RepID=A0A2U1MBT4_ARTAN|nr:phospholipase D [Artemisia annua]
MKEVWASGVWFRELRRKSAEAMKSMVGQYQGIRSSTYGENSFILNRFKVATTRRLLPSSKERYTLFVDDASHNGAAVGKQRPILTPAFVKSVGRHICQQPFSRSISTQELFCSIDGGVAFGFPDIPKWAENAHPEGQQMQVLSVDGYIHAIRRGKNFIYIENQYFLGSSFALQADDIDVNDVLALALSQVFPINISWGPVFTSQVPGWPPVRRYIKKDIRLKKTNCEIKMFSNYQQAMSNVAGTYAYIAPGKYLFPSLLLDDGILLLLTLLWLFAHKTVFTSQFHLITYLHLLIELCLFSAEYGHMMNITEKNDVYSYGVVFIEILSGCNVVENWLREDLHMVGRILQFNEPNTNGISTPTVTIQPHLQGEVKRMEETIGANKTHIGPGNGAKYRVGPQGCKTHIGPGNGAKYRVGPQGWYTKIEKRPPYEERKISLEEMVDKHIEESSRKNAKFQEWMNEMEVDTERNLRNQSAAIKNLKTQIGQLEKNIRIKTHRAELEECKVLSLNEENEETKRNRFRGQFLWS